MSSNWRFLNPLNPDPAARGLTGKCTITVNGSGGTGGDEKHLK
jgi:hypothetical protein